jgi:hypothetical protein
MLNLKNIKTFVICVYEDLVVSLYLPTNETTEEVNLLHSPPSSAEAKKDGAIPPLLHMSSQHSA